MSRIRLAVVALATVAASLVLTAGASARTHDRNHDRLPDRWEHKHQLSLHHNQARRDEDHDGLNNRGEFKARLNPRDADSDNDGIEDGDENAGTVTSFDGTTLVIALAGGGSLTGTVDDTTEMECDDHSSSARAADRGDDDQGEDQGSEDQGDDDQGDDDQGDDQEACGTDALKAGTRVEEAELRTRGGTAVFSEIHLLP